MSDSDGPRARRLRRLCLENDLPLDGNATVLESRLVRAGLLEAREEEFEHFGTESVQRMSEPLTESQLHKLKKQE